MNLSQQLGEGLAALGLDLPAPVQARLLGYVALLKKWNTTYNLTAIRNEREMVGHHLLDSLSVLPALQESLRARGLSVGAPILAKLARVGLQDDIGVLLGARATLICLGERPGLGTGDSLSIYLAIGPKLDQDNAEKNCISNVRPLGIQPAEAARETVAILRRAFAAGRGGVAAP